MFTLRIENSRGSSLVLTQNESNYQVVSVAGLNPPSAIINTTTIAGMDGAQFNSSKLNTRNVVITLRLNGDVEGNRQTIYRYCKTKDLCTVYFKNENRDVFIKGYVETVEVDLFQRSELMQISIICPQPYWQAATATVKDISVSLAAFTFPFAINIDEPVPFSTLAIDSTVKVTNASTDPVGAVFTVTFGVSAFELMVWNTTTNESFGLYYAFETGDVVTVDTSRGQKSVKLTRGGITSNLFSALFADSVLFQLDAGDNYLAYAVDGGDNNSNVSITVTYRTQYRGV